MDFSKYKYTITTHKGQEVILIQFEFSHKLKDDLRQRFPSAKWSQTKKSWYLPNLPSIRRALDLNEKSEVDRRVAKINPVNRKA